MKYVSVLLLLFFSLSGCIDKEKKYINDMMEILSNIPSFSISNYNYIVVIPGVGCSGCISEAESFFLENKNDSVFFIFTKINSLKHLRLRVGDSINNKNVYIDKDDVVLHYDVNKSLYPLVFDIKKKDDIKYDYLSPGYNIEL